MCADTFFSTSQDMASPKTLREWCLLTCACYPNVEIKNMSASFRDGLAFCAIIHRHRPDLIDFSSLSKDNVYQNNKLAFDTAETKLGIPALLDPKDMVSTKVPDSLSVITYLSQYHHFFNRKSYAGPASLRSSHVTVLNNHTKTKASDRLKFRKSLSDLETSKDLLSKTKPRTVCILCFKPVHLIQRHLIDGKVYHRSCFRCKVCHSTLLPGSYTKGRDAGSLICSHHVTDSKNTPHSHIRSTAIQPRRTSQTGYFSLGGLAITSIPHYTKQTESQDRLVCKIADMEGDEKEECNRENRDCTVQQESKVKNPEPPPLSVAGRTVEGAENAGQVSCLADGEVQQEMTKTQELTELSSSCAQVTEGSSQPVSAPRRMSDSSAVPRPASRNKASQTTSRSPAAGNSYIQNKRSPSSNHIPTRESPQVKTKHPWLTIIHPGPWTQLPPAAAPVPIARSKSVSNLRLPSYRPKVAGPNPFEEDADEETQEEETKPEPADQTDPSAALILLGNVSNMGGVTNTVCTSSEPVGDTCQSSLSGLGETGKTGGLRTDVTGTAAGLHATSDEAQHASLPRSLSVPAITSANGQSSFTAVATTEANESGQAVQAGTSCQSKLACKENPFDRKPGMSKSKAAPSEPAPAPGHGFPLIKRKVRTDQDISTEDLQAQMNELDKHLAALEQRGVELERNLRHLKNDQEEEPMLMEWFSLVHERHVLLRRDTELVYLTKQQTFDEIQADVEYELRCLLNKPECDWSQDDRGREQQLMDELVAIIEQRNEIVSNLDQDRQREREEDLLLEDMMKNKEFQKEELKEMKKSKGKFRASKVFKMLNHKAERTKDSTDKKS